MLKRELKFLDVLLSGIALIVGAGIYVLISLASSYAKGGLWISFILAAVLALFTGFSYAELSSIFPVDSAEYTYVEKAFNKKLGFFIAILLLFSLLFSSSVVALGFANYLSSIFDVNVVFAAVLLETILLIPLLLGAKTTSFLAGITTFFGLFGLLLVVLFSIPYFPRGEYLHFDLQGIFRATAIIFFAYLGFEQITKFSEEVHEPHKTIPKAIIFSILITALIYLLVSMSALSVLGWKKLASSKAPLGEVVKKAAPFFKNEISLFLVFGALLLTLNTTLLLLFSASRLLYSLGKKIHFLSFFSKEVNGNPIYSVFFVFLFSVSTIILLGGISAIVEFANASIFLVFLFVNLSVIVLRKKMPYRKRMIKAPWFFPYLGALFSFFFLLSLGANTLIYFSLFSLLLLILIYIR